MPEGANLCSRGRWLLVPLALCVTGCPPPAELPAAHFTQAQAISRLNMNNARITAALQARQVRASGYYEDEDGKRRSFHLDGGILFLKPRNLYFDLRQLGQTVMRFGSNPEEYWLWVQPELDTLWWGRYEDLDVADSSSIPIRPDLLIQALGLETVSDAGSPDEQLLFRVTDDHHQLLCVRLDADGRARLIREYWLDRRPPYLIRRILFRDEDGRATFFAELDEYRPVRDADALAAHRIRVGRNDPDTIMDLRIGSWRVRPNVDSSSSAFRRPADRPTTHRVE